MRIRSVSINSIQGKTLGYCDNFIRYDKKKPFDKDIIKGFSQYHCSIKKISFS